MLIYCLIIIIIFIIIKYLYFTEKFNEIENMKIYFINLDINKNRLLSIKKQSKNINLTRFAAINGKYVNEKKLIRDKILFKNHRLLKGQLGCALSHYYLLKKIYKSSNNISIVLEDDIIIPDNFKSKLQNILNNLPAKWDIIWLGGCNIKGKLINNMFIKPTVYSGMYNLCTHAYLVNKKSIPNILKYLIPIYRPIDSQLRTYFKKLNIYYVYPNLIYQDKNMISVRRELDNLQQSEFWKNKHDKVTIV